MSLQVVVVVRATRAQEVLTGESGTLLEEVDRAAGTMAPATGGTTAAATVTPGAITQTKMTGK